jgi:putative two-component system response regulator
VLVVEDEEAVRHVLGLVAMRAGGKAVFAESGERAIELFAEHEYACALIDKNLPDLSGLELLKRLKERWPRTEAMIVTGYANMETAIEAIRLGAFDYIIKPFDVATIVHRVSLALERRRLREGLETAMTDLRVANARISESRQEVKRAYLESVLRLSLAAEYKDDAASDHIHRMSRYAGILARQVEATEAWVENIVYAAPLHDIGKIGVADSILRKPGPLTAQERRAIEEHTTLGARILEGTTSDVLLLAHELVLTHHERWDGRGYPRRLKGDEIPLSGRLIAVIDTWDAVSTDRCYRRAMTVDKAIEELRRSAGSALDETLVTAFLDCLPQVRAVLEETQ